MYLLVWFKSGLLSVNVRKTLIQISQYQTLLKTKEERLIYGYMNF